MRLDGLTAVEAAALREELLHRPPPGAARRPGSTRGRGGPPRRPRRSPRSSSRAWTRAGSATRPSRSPASSPSASCSASCSTSPTRRTSTPRTGARRAISPIGSATRRSCSPRWWSRCSRWWPSWSPRPSATRSPSGTSASPAIPAAPCTSRRGLITTRATTIEERRLHGAEISEPLLLRDGRGRAPHRHRHRPARRPRRRARRVAARAPRAARRGAARGRRGHRGRRAGDAPARRARAARPLRGATPARSSGGRCSSPRWRSSTGRSAARPGCRWPRSRCCPSPRALAADRYRNLGHAIAGTAPGRQQRLARAPALRAGGRGHHRLERRALVLPAPRGPGHPDGDHGRRRPALRRAGRRDR